MWACVSTCNCTHLKEQYVINLKFTLKMVAYCEKKNEQAIAKNIRKGLLFKRLESFDRAHMV